MGFSGRLKKFFKPQLKPQLVASKIDGTLTGLSHSPRFCAVMDGVTDIDHVAQQPAAEPSPTGVGWLNWLRARALLIVAVAAVLMLTALGLPQHISQDTWLALVAGRSIAAHGIPSHDYLTQLAYGVRWTDQQWLVQLVMYELVRVGGIQLLSIFYVLLTGCVFGGVMAAARALGAEDLHVLMLLPPGAFFFLTTAVAVRGQGFAYPLFVLCLWLLARELPRRRAGDGWKAPPRWQAYCVFPVLVLWSNLHGSVTLAVLITMIFGFTLAVGAARQGGARALRGVRPWSFVVLAPLTLLATPYGFRILHYYRTTLGNHEFSHLVTEWEPVYRYPILAIPLFALFVVSVWLIWRARRRMPLFDVLVLLVLALAATDAVRNITWFGLAAMILLPAAVSAAHPEREAPLRRSNLNLGLALSMLVLTVLVLATVAAQPASWFEREFPSSAVPIVSAFAQSHPDSEIFADVRYADWLIWKNPKLAGRVAYDTSFELLSRSDLKSIVAVGAKPDAKALKWLEQYGLWVLNPGNHAATREILKTPGVVPVIHNRKILIVLWRGPSSDGR